MSAPKGWRGKSLLARVKADVALRKNKSAAERWIKLALAGDAALGRSAQNWAEDPARAIKGALPALRARGITVYCGSGQLVLVDFKPKDPVIMQRRPLAQREVVFHIED